MDPNIRNDDIRPSYMPDRGARVDTKKTSTTLKASPHYEQREFRQLPPWARNITDGLRKLGAGAGVAVCGALALGTLVPFGIASLVCLKKSEGKYENQMAKACVILGAPILGILICLDQIRGNFHENDTIDMIKKTLELD